MNRELGNALDACLRDCLFVGGILYKDKTYRTIYNSNEKGLYRVDVIKNMASLGRKKKRC